MAAKKSKTKIAHHPPSDLSIETCDDGYILMLDKKPVLTPAGFKVVHKRYEVLEHILAEFKTRETKGLTELRSVEPGACNSFEFYRVQKEVIESQKESSLDFDKCLVSEDLFQSLPSNFFEAALFAPVEAWLYKLGIEWPYIDHHCDYRTDPDKDEDFCKNRGLYFPPKSFSDEIGESYRSLTPEQRATVYVLHARYKGIIFPLLLALGECTVYQYCEYSTRSYDSNSLWCEIVERDIGSAFKWLALFQSDIHQDSPAKAMISEIAKGESTKREFKSSLRWHIHKKSHDEVITHACLKTIAAFLNGEGGVLLIGVEDRGGICGIEHDGFPDDDKFLLHLYNYIQDWLGNQHATRVKTDVISVAGKKVCRVDCQPFAGEWAYLRRKGEEEFLVRVGPSSKPLKPSEIATYMASHKSS